ncbi:glycosyltransferase family 2 protein [Solilutibacter pythonis]|uniref:glycosyltransferase family 2 protein n=1 Tax=Solilutibacter pythonis TaxID=2483112 RepID=UPI0011C42FB5|nr:glycosyltransferase family 2 protein [Lysobacter pythonis]
MTYSRAMQSAQEKLPLSGVVVAKNEADRIGRCVASLMPVCREVIVLDSGSGDATVAIARELGARVEHRDWDGFARQKNAAIARATQPWVILLDADEWLEADAQDALRALFAGEIEQADVWLLLRRTHWLGQPMRHGSFAREAIERLFRADLRHADVPVHEYLDTAGRTVRRSRIRLEHDTARSAREYRNKLAKYAALWAEARAARGKNAWPGRGLLAAAAYALKNLIVQGGALDGHAGRAFHREHMRYAALKYRLLREFARRR